jgi:hypothetical protein
MFPIKHWEKGKTIEELAHSAGEQKVIDKIKNLVNTDISMIRGSQ